jgi:hypothetical protein
MPTYNFNNVGVNAENGRLSVGANLAAASPYATVIGTGAGAAGVSGLFNTVVGSLTGTALTNGAYNTLIGGRVAPLSTGIYNTLLGSQAGYSLTTGSNNTYVGLNADFFNSTGSNNTVIGTTTYDSQMVSGNSNTVIGANVTSYGGNVSNTVILSDGANSKNLIADLNSVRFNRPVIPKTYTVVTLPSAATTGTGAISYATNGRKAGEAAGAGTGCPVYSNGTSWLTFYGNTQVLA